MPTESGYTSTDEEDFVRKCKMKAIEIARDMRPQNTYAPLGQQKLPEPAYNLISEADKIYQWLIKIS